MSVYTNHFYRPFINSSLAFSLDFEKLEDSFSGFLIHDIKLFYQPVQEPNIGITFFIIRSVIVILSELINFKVLNKMKRNTGLLKSMTKLQSYNNMIVSLIT